MTKADIINEVAIATGMPKKEVGTVVEAFMEELRSASSKRRTMYTCVASAASTSSIVLLRLPVTSLRIQPSPFQLTTYQASSHQRASSRRCRTLSNTAGQEERNIIFYNNNILKF